MRKDYIYRQNSFVAVLSDDMDSPFWIGRVTDSHKSGNGVVFNLSVH